MLSGTRAVQDFTRAIIISLSSLGIVKQSNGDKDHFISLISLTANSTMHELDQFSSFVSNRKGNYYTVAYRQS
jgi:hypothetical protein